MQILVVVVLVREDLKCRTVSERTMGPISVVALTAHHTPQSTAFQIHRFPLVYSV
jgi:hypothetical protein